ncbi:hypothetical protein FACS1894130_09810 [Spirochaetia bacterium]|nr:hypothetical protein FACS1894130_09810 [Spirochaetia bacterium]
MKANTNHVCVLWGWLLVVGGLFLALQVSSCSTFATAAGVSAQAAGEAGLIDPYTAAAIVQSGENWLKATEDITPEQAYYIGRAVGANILINYRIDASNPSLVQYLNKIATALAINSAQPDRTLVRLYNGYHVAILDSTEINAFSTSGGHIFVTRGLLQCAASEDALAAVLAHEIAHIQLQHSIRAIKTSRITQALMYTGSSVVGAATTGTSLEELTNIFDESVTDIVSEMINNGYSRSQEFDADALALFILASAGYDPVSLLDMLRELDKNQSPGGFNKTHPAPKARITNANRKIGAYKVADTRSYRRARFSALR